MKTYDPHAGPFAVSNIARQVQKTNSGYSISGGKVYLTGTDFGVKPSATKPFFVFRADDGLSPNATLGRSVAWGESAFNGAVNTTEVAPGASQSVAFDLSEGGAALADIELPAGTQRFAVYRRIFMAFNTRVDYATRTRVNTASITGTNPAVGQTVTGATSGATGVVREFTTGSSNGTIYYERGQGTIYAQTPTDFIIGETLTWPGGSGTNGEGGAGTFRTFNNKEFRAWANRGAGNFRDWYVSQGWQGSSGSLLPPATIGHFRAVEGAAAGDPVGSEEDVVGYAQEETQGNWITQLFLVDHGTLDTKDAIAQKWQDGHKFFASDTWTFLTTDKPDPLTEIFQNEVSNGCYPGSIVYFDRVIAENSWHFVLLKNAAGKMLMMEDSSWADGLIVTDDVTDCMTDWTSIEVYAGSLTPLATFTRV